MAFDPIFSGFTRDSVTDNRKLFRENNAYILKSCGRWFLDIRWIINIFHFRDVANKSLLIMNRGKVKQNRLDSGITFNKGGRASIGMIG